MEYDQEKSTDNTCTDFQFEQEDAFQTDTLSDNVPKNKHTPERDDYDILTSTKGTDTAKQNDKKQSTDSGLRRSSRVREPPKEWWIARPSSEDGGSSEKGVALIGRESVPHSYDEVMQPENRNFWLPAIEKEEKNSPE